MQYTSSSENYVSSYRNSPSRWSGDDNKEYEYKKASYKYANNSNYTNNSNNSLQTSSPSNNNIDQLDVLLEDLKNERRISKEKDYGMPIASSYTNTIREHERSTSRTPVLTKVSKITKTTKEIEPTITYDDKLRSGNYSTHKIYNEFQRRETSEERPISVKSTATHSSSLKNEVEDIALPANLLPPPGTKVTTTVRTYTYEIPAGESTTATDFSTSRTSTLNRSMIKQRTDEATDMAAYELSRKPLPASNVYHTESYSSTSKTEKQPIVTPNQVYEVRELREVTNTVTPQPRNQTVNNTVVYNVSSTTRNPNEPLTNGGPHPIPVDSPYGRTSNRTAITTIDKSYISQTDVPQPPPETNVSYHYHTSSTTTSGQHGPNYGAPPSKPAPFPVDRVDFQKPNDVTPTKVDDLMQSFENTDINNSDLNSTHRKREIDTATASPKQQHVPSVNRPGKEVFYPPGHEMLITQRQEMSGASGGGRWAKASGNYEYESGAKSSSKSKSGATMVPVCLPLCCAMPCSIM